MVIPIGITENQAGMLGLYYAASRGLAVIVMEPLLGGRLANPPGPIAELFRQHGKQRRIFMDIANYTQ